MPPKKTLRSQKNKAVRNRAVKSFTKSRVKNAIDALRIVPLKIIKNY